MDDFAQYFAPTVSGKATVVQISDAERLDYNETMRKCAQEYKVRHMRSVWAANKMAFTR